jgi:L-lactate dehydrogenase complex protein LldE
LLSRYGSGDAPTTAQVRIASALRIASSTGREGNVRALRVALFITCFNDTLFPQTGRAVVRLLERLGHEVEFREEQTCCGQMHFNTGYAKEALGLARRFARVFDGADAIVTPSASCAGMVRHAYPRQLDVDAPPVHELSEFLVDELGVEDVGAYFPHRVTYHPTCHGLRLLELGDRPLRLLRHVRGIDLVELPEAEECCGFGGTFAVKNKDVSSAMLTDKMRAVLDTGAEIVTAGDNSCLMHIGGGLSRQRAGVRAMHLAEILAHTEEDARP